MEKSNYRGRFAPSPTGELHFGSLIAAVGSYLDARANKGEWLVRIEDVDETRCHREYETSILKTLEAFGFEWDEPVIRQTDRIDAYRAAFDELMGKGLIYACACTRRELADSAVGMDGAPVYPGRCRKGLPEGKTARAWRLRVPDKMIGFNDRIQGHQKQNLEKEAGDFILLRSDGLFAYQLAVVVDDAQQGINHVVRGADLLASTPRQMWLYECLNQPVPVYAHLPLAVNENGEKLSKQTHAAPINQTDPVTMLLAAMRFLNVVPEKNDMALHDLWNCAIMNWSINIVPQTQTIKTPI